MKKVILMFVLLSSISGIAMANYTYSLGLGYSASRHKSDSNQLGESTYYMPYGVGFHAGIGWSVKENSKNFLGIEISGSFNFNFGNSYHYGDRDEKQIISNPASQGYRHHDRYGYHNRYEPSKSVRVNTSATNQLRFLMGIEFLEGLMIVPFAGLGIDNVSSFRFSNNGEIISYYGETLDGNYTPGYTDMLVLGGLRLEFGSSFYVEIMLSENLLLLPSLEKLNRLEIGVGFMKRHWSK